MVSTDVREKANPGPRAQGSSHLMDSWNLLEQVRTGLAFAQTSEQQCINCHVSIFATEQQVRFSSHGQWLPLYGNYEEHDDGMKWDSMGFPNLTSGLCQNERSYQFIVCGYKKDKPIPSLVFRWFGSCSFSCFRRSLTWFQTDASLVLEGMEDCGSSWATHSKHWNSWHANACDMPSPTSLLRSQKPARPFRVPWQCWALARSSARQPTWNLHPIES